MSLRRWVLVNGWAEARPIALRFGTKQFRVNDESRNNWLLAILTFGDGWHTNHHRFPDPARHGILPGQIDIAGRVIELFEKLGLVRSVVRVALESPN